MPAAIRRAIMHDVPAITGIVDAAYRSYIPRIGKPPGPMLDDYGAHVAEGVAWVLAEGTEILGMTVLLPRPDHLLLDNVAVAPAYQGRGLGRRLVAFAEEEAARCGFAEVRLYTHALMHENRLLYLRLGFEETGRGRQAGYDRVFMRKCVSKSALARHSSERGAS